MKPNIKGMEINEKINLKESIKSKYVIKEVFSFLPEKLKLKMIIYNKIFQELFNVNIENYYNMSVKFKKGGRNGEGIEYDFKTSNIRFKGEYLNGKKHGRGKEYNKSGDIIFEGEYANGYKIEGKGYNRDHNLIFYLEKNGKGKEYYYGNELKFEGEYLHGKRWNGKGYDKKGNLQFELKYGRGRVYEYDNDNELIFEGEYLDGERWKGKEYNKYGARIFRIFEGEYMNGTRFNGKVKEFYKNNLIFEGEYLKGKRNGRGKEYYGKGLDHWEIVDLIKKNFKDYKHLLKFEGEYLNGERNGKGKEYNRYGALIFEGEYLNGKRNNGTRIKYTKYGARFKNY